MVDRSQTWCLTRAPNPSGRPVHPGRTYRPGYAAIGMNRAASADAGCVRIVRSAYSGAVAFVTLSVPSGPELGVDQSLYERINDFADTTSWAHGIVRAFARSADTSFPSDTPPRPEPSPRSARVASASPQQSPRARRRCPVCTSGCTTPAMSSPGSSSVGSSRSPSRPSLDRSPRRSPAGRRRPLRWFIPAPSRQPATSMPRTDARTSAYQTVQPLSSPPDR